MRTTRHFAPRLWLAAAITLSVGGPFEASAGDPALPASSPPPPVQIIDDVAVWTDEAGDAMLRRTDPVNIGKPFPYSATLPDVRTIRLSGWLPTPGANDRYSGVVVPAAEAHIFRMDIVFNGLLNPPGTLGMNGRPFAPLTFGPNPVYGFVEIDIDNDVDTGGEVDDSARHLFLANVGRFAGVPQALGASRMVRFGDELDGVFGTSPQYERSGVEFILSMCGCWSVVLRQEIGDGDGVMETGETFHVDGRFFQRSGGFRNASGALNGSVPGAYDPVVPLRFSHDMYTNRTTVTLVYALDQMGASILTNTPKQAPNTDVGDHTSMQEAMHDVVKFLGFSTPPGAQWVICQGWANRDVMDYLDPTTWEVTALFGVPYPDKRTAVYVYTDLGFRTSFGDLSGDGDVDEGDRQAVHAAIVQYDGGLRDADAGQDQSVRLADFARNFSVFDVNYNGFIDDEDADAIVGGEAILGDLNGDGTVNSSDLAIILGSWGIAAIDSHIDLNNDGLVNSSDLALVLGNWGVTRGS